MKELYRVLKKNGYCAFLVPIALNINAIDEEWGLSPAENWRRFGQDDHCRRYNRDGLIHRLESVGFHVNICDINYFGKNIYTQCGLTSQSILYVLTKENVL